MDKNKLHESYYLDMLLVTSVIVRLDKKTPVKEFSKRISFNLTKNNL